jgi:uncharacterized protein
MPVNAHPEYTHAEKAYHLAQTTEEQLKALETMISFAPAHKGGENLRAQLKTRYKKLKEKIAKAKKSGKSTKVGIKKDDMQVAIIGFSNVGKSSLLDKLTNASPKISEVEFSTRVPVIGMMGVESVSIQMIEVPAFGSVFFDKGLVNSADTLVLVIEKFEDISKLEKGLDKAQGKRIIALNKVDSLSENEKRKISSKLQSKKHEFVLVSGFSGEGMEELKSKIFTSFDKIRVFTKEPGKKRSPRPIIMKPGSVVGEVAEKILKGFSKKVKEVKIWGPSSKFSGQTVGMKHKLKDLDVVEFRTK